MRAANLAVVMALAVGCGQQASPKPPPNAVEKDVCTSPDDCTLVEACCGCSAGGKRVAIRKDAVAEYDGTRSKRCGDTVCAAVMSTHSSCNAEATCENGHCKVMAHMGSLPQ